MEDDAVVAGEVEDPPLAADEAALCEPDAAVVDDARRLEGTVDAAVAGAHDMHRPTAQLQHRLAGAEELCLVRHAGRKQPLASVELADHRRSVTLVLRLVADGTVRADAD